MTCATPAAAARSLERLAGHDRGPRRFARSPATRRHKIRQKFGLQIDVGRLPDETDRTPGKRDIVSWLDPLQILEEEATTRKHGLAVVLRFEQLLGRLSARSPERPMAVDAVRVQNDLPLTQPLRTASHVSRAAHGSRSVVAVASA